MSSWDQRYQGLDMVQALAPGGYFVGVLYHPKQLQHHSGGPKDPAKLADIHSFRISQYRHGRMRLPLWAMLKIAEQLQI